MARRASGQQQGGDICTGDEQHDAVHKREHRERRPSCRDRLLLDGLNIETACSSGSGSESGPDVGFGRSASPITLASSVAASAEMPSRNRAITAPAPGHDRTGDATVIAAQ
jgi:hypothetical protein